MPRTHVVKQGEHAPSIAARYGFQTFAPIWNDPANADLKKARKTPEILLPGDELSIPDKDGKDVEVPTGKRHRFRLKSERLELRLRVRDLAGQPVAGAACSLDAGGGAEDGLVTDGGGVVKARIDRDASQATLVVGEETFDIAIGELDPIDVESGWQARLINLGYLEAPVRDTGEDDADDIALVRRSVRSAIEEFQCDEGLSLSGEMDDATRAALRDAHGC
jgi:Putative peptidoglycan binding domain